MHTYAHTFLDMSNECAATLGQSSRVWHWKGNIKICLSHFLYSWTMHHFNNKILINEELKINEQFEYKDHVFEN